MCLEFPLNKHRTQDPSQDERSHLASRAVGEILLVSANGMDVSGGTFSWLLLPSILEVHLLSNTQLLINT